MSSSLKDAYNHGSTPQKSDRGEERPRTNPPAEYSCWRLAQHIRDEKHQYHYRLRRVSDRPWNEAELTYIAESNVQFELNSHAEAMVSYWPGQRDGPERITRRWLQMTSWYGP